MVRPTYLYHLAQQWAGAQLPASPRSTPSTTSTSSTPSTSFGIDATGIRLDWRKVVARKDEVVRTLEREKQREVADLGIHVIRAKATFVSAHEVDLRGQRVVADRVVLALGSKAARLPIPGADLAMTSDEALRMRELPESIVIVGGGVIAMEFAHIWNRAGVRVTVMEIGPRILSCVDEELADEVARLSRERGIEILERSAVSRIAQVDGSLLLRIRAGDSDRDLRTAAVLLATGRTPNTEGLGLEAAGVRTERRAIVVDEYLETTTPGIYSGGDANGKHGLAPVAAHEGRLAARNALRGNREKADYRLVTSTVFTQPAASSVGLTEVEARAEWGDVEVVRFPFASLGRAMIDGETDGFVKVVTDGPGGPIVGAHILGARSEDLILQLAIAMRGNLTLADLADVIPINPSYSEAVHAAALTAVVGHKETCCV